MLFLKYRFSDYYYLYLFAVICWSIIFSILALFRKKITKYNSKFTSNIIFYLFLLAISFSFLGLTIGLLVGLSLTPVIGVVIPALLTFFGGFVTYAFVYGQKKNEQGYVLILILISISFFVILGSDYGSSMRIVYEQMIKKPNAFLNNSTITGIKQDSSTHTNTEFKIDATLKPPEVIKPTKSFQSTVQSHTFRNDKRRK